ncbi:methyltransferase [Oceanisphaera profunda]|uniref:Methyltransferase n=1 Tax=Oceanisphaera profunda TaxID=1416627 RepID=A0A1Y0D519_9GAMM|nr:methyltransferase [Oceanisphaera profunda]ART82609.1 methyltransferase [Oceanisphaera profunda]
MSNYTPTHADTFLQLSLLLQHARHDWQHTPFSCTQLPWPELAKPLQALDEDELDTLDADDDAAFAWLSQYRPELLSSQQLTLPELARAPNYATPRWSSGIGGRKWAQIKDFAANIHAINHKFEGVTLTQPILEWCAGKGHLGRLLAQQGAPKVTSLEWAPDLCTQGEALANQLQLPHEFVCANALSPQAAALFKPQQIAVALHACGELHLRFLEHAAAAGTQQLAVSPCCYHLIADEHYQPLSQAGQQHDLQLDRHSLRLPLQQQITGGERVRRLRHIELTWRLAFDELQQTLTADSSYLPLPSFPKRLLSGDFSDFVLWACEKKSLTPPHIIDSEHWLALAASRRLLVKRIEFVRHRYRYLLELWLLLDKALFLEEQGYQVQLGLFTDLQHTPRRYLLQATLP